MQLEEVFTNTKEGILINIYLTPGAHKSYINGIIKTIDNKVYIKVSVNSKPIENKANIDLISVISCYFDIPKTNIEIKRGSKSRYKQLLLRNSNIEAFMQSIKTLIK